MTYYIGSTPQEAASATPGSRFFYGLRRTHDGELYFGRVDQLLGTDSIELNNPGGPDESYAEFEMGTDFFDGRNDDHEIQYDNLKYEQYRWDDRNIYYYIDSEGQLVARINRSYTYPTGI